MAKNSKLDPPPLTYHKFGQNRSKFDLSKITQNALHTAPGGQISSFLTFWTYLWALGAHSRGTQQIRDLAEEAPKGPKMTQNDPEMTQKRGKGPQSFTL